MSYLLLNDFVYKVLLRVFPLPDSSLIFAFYKKDSIRNLESVLLGCGAGKERRVEERGWKGQERGKR